jgi:hypothetical protein
MTTVAFSPTCNAAGSRVIVHLGGFTSWAWAKKETKRKSGSNRLPIFLELNVIDEVDLLWQTSI